MRVAEAESENLDKSGSARAGFFFALSAYVLWGFLPIFMKALDHVDPVEIMAHRAFWSVPVAAFLLWIMGQTGDILPTFKSLKRIVILSITAAIISLNWGVYVWAIAVERTLETALGYYINPLITVAMGAFFLGERFKPAQLVALLIAVVAVLVLTIQGGIFPWISLVLAFSFALYGFLRKTIDVGPTQGFLVEVLLLAPFALGYIVYAEASQTGNLFRDGWSFAMLLSCGPVTAVPLILYAFGAKRLRLSTIGLMQYIAPSLIFLIGLFVFKEPFGLWQAVTFSMIWTALVIYTWSALQSR